MSDRTTKRERGRRRVWPIVRDFFRRPRARRPAPAGVEGNLKVYLFNVGQGDHILLEFPNGEYGVIDFYYEETLGLKEPPALTYLEHLRRLEPGKEIALSFISISHPDYDHVKGADSFLSWVRENRIRVDHFWVFAGSNFDDLYRQYDMAFRKYAATDQERDDAFEFRDRLQGIRKFLAHLERRRPKGNVDYLQGIRRLGGKIGGFAEVNLLAPLTRHVRRFDSQSLTELYRLFIQRQRHRNAATNLLSSVLSVKFGWHSLLFGGDTGKDVWLECLRDFREQGHEEILGGYEANFVKVSHHGSKDSSQPELWESILRRESDCHLGISAGKGYDFPHKETLDDIADAARTIGSRATILSTNSCTACVFAQRVPAERFDWLRYPSPDYPDETMETFSLLAPSVPGDEKAKPVLAAYVFEFAGDSDRVEVTKGLSPLLSRHTPCLYNNGHRKPFPHCA